MPHIHNLPSLPVTTWPPKAHCFIPFSPPHVGCQTPYTPTLMHVLRHAHFARIKLPPFLYLTMAYADQTEQWQLQLSKFHNTPTHRLHPPNRVRFRKVLKPTTTRNRHLTVLGVHNFGFNLQTLGLRQIVLFVGMASYSISMGTCRFVPGMYGGLAIFHTFSKKSIF